MLIPHFLSNFRKVYLGCKKTQPDQVYAIKAMKKDDMIQKNMIQQGKILKQL